MRDFKGMKRQRGRNRKPGGNNANNANPNRSWDSQGPENIKVRGNAQTVYERYMQLARDASSGGDRVLAENYLQHAEHYFRVLRALQPARPVSEIAARELTSQGFDIDFEDETGAQAAAFLAAQQAAERAQQQAEGRQNEPRQNDQRQNEGRQNETRAFEPREPRQSEGEDGEAGREGGRRESRRERWERRREERNRRFDGDGAPSEDAPAEASETPAEPTPAEASEAPRPARRTRAPRPVEDEAAGESALPGFLTRPSRVEPPAVPAEAPSETAGEADAAAAPRRRAAPRRKAAADTSE